jgi:GDP-D-mannose dehydratase
MYLMLQQERSDDSVIATGESYQLAEFIEIAFQSPSYKIYLNLCRST